MLAAALRFLSLFVAAAIGGAMVWWLGGGHGQPPAPSAGEAALAPSFLRGPATVEVTQMPAAARVKLGGYVEPRNVVRLTAQAPGRIVYVAGQEGDRIGAGQIVAALDDDALRPQYRAAWAGLAGDMAAYENAQTQLYHNLYGPKTSPMGGPGYEAYDRAAVPFYNMAQSFMNQFVPGATSGPNSFFGGGPNQFLQSQSQAQRGFPAINNSRADYERQMAGMVAGQSRIDQLDSQLRDRRAIAPRAGAIVKRYVRLGDIVQPGQPLADIADVDELEVRLEVPIDQVGQLKIGDQVPVTLGNSNIWAPVAQIFPTADAMQRTVTVKLAIPASARAAPGMYALAWVAQGRNGASAEAAPAVPNSAIAYRGSLPVAFAVSERGAIEMRVLRLGDSMGDRTAVLSGLQPGDRVIANPSPHLKANDGSTDAAH